MNPLFAAAAEIQRLCRERGWGFCFIGGLAVLRWGEPRVTRDIDVTILAGFGAEAAVVDQLLDRFGARIEQARKFALRETLTPVRRCQEGHLDADGPVHPCAPGARGAGDHRHGRPQRGFRRALREMGGVYLAITGGAASYQTTQVEAIEEAHWLNLMPECLWKFRVPGVRPAVRGHGLPRRLRLPRYRPTGGPGAPKRPTAGSACDPGRVRVCPGSSERSLIDPRLDCIACGACYSSCVIAAVGRDFLGPGALNRALVLMTDSRDGRDGRLVRRHLAGIAVPPAICDTALERAGRLTSEARAMLRAAAALAHPAPEPGVARVAGLATAGRGPAWSWSWAAVC